VLQVRKLPRPFRESEAHFGARGGFPGTQPVIESSFGDTVSGAVTVQGPRPRSRRGSNAENANTPFPELL